MSSRTVGIACLVVSGSLLLSVLAGLSDRDLSFYLRLFGVIGMAVGGVLVLSKVSNTPVAVEKPPQARSAWGFAIGAVLVWFGLWYLTPGLLSNGVGSLFTEQDALSVLIETILALVIVVVLVLLHHRYNRELFARSWSLWMYALPLVLGIALPFHYSLPLPVTLYVFWMTVSVLWQDYLTFGLLQKYLADLLPTWAVIVASAVIFWAGHALFLPDKFGPAQVLPSLAMLALGLVLASLRAWLKTLHVILALHLSFYFIFA